MLVVTKNMVFVWVARVNKLIIIYLASNKPFDALYEWLADLNNCLGNRPIN